MTEVMTTAYGMRKTSQPRIGEARSFWVGKLWNQSETTGILRGAFARAVITGQC